MIYIFAKHNFTICNKYGVFKKVPELNCPKLYDKRGNSTRNIYWLYNCFCAHFVNLNLQFVLKHPTKLWGDAVHLFRGGYLYNLS